MQSLIDELASLRAAMLALESATAGVRARVDPVFQESARNLVHYLAVRAHDIRPLQERLAALGLSSLGRAESHVLATVNAVIRALSRMAGAAVEPGDGKSPVEYEQGRALLARRTEAVLGAAPAGRAVRIMVTLPSEAADDYSLVHRLVAAGMDCARINCAHDDQAAWVRMIANLRRAEQSVGRHCRVSMDLAGPKIRTGPIVPGPAVARIRPGRDAFGRRTAPARIWLSPADQDPRPPSPADATIPLERRWLGRLEIGERLSFSDARGATRRLRVVDRTDAGVWAEAMKAAYVVVGTTFRREQEFGESAAVERLPAAPGRIAVATGDLLLLRRDAEPGRPVTRDAVGRVLTPASIGCTLPQALERVRVGDAVWFDDGRVGGVVERVLDDHLEIRLDHVRAEGDRLLADRGINLPDSDIAIPALTDKDRSDLVFAASHADLVALSFASEARDVEAMLQALSRDDGRPVPAIILKIETRRGFEQLPTLLLSAMQGQGVGVMIARGDLAVECGFERLAEVQEEILWISEAAHVPVIWATQVLETLAKTGIPSRAEITDAAMGNRAECVMLNKGPHVADAVTALDGILRRMAAHQAKKSPMLRELQLARMFEAGLAPDRS